MSAELDGAAAEPVHHARAQDQPLACEHTCVIPINIGREYARGRVTLALRVTRSLLRAKVNAYTTAAATD